MPRLAALPADPTQRIVGDAPAIRALRAQIHRLATFDDTRNLDAPTVLLQGETGTGKGLVARVIHDSGPRALAAFIDVNCAAIPETLLEAELFGYEAGAFTDAKRLKPGLFEAASGGTLFLDELEALPLLLQGKLLKAIDEKRVRRLGAVRDMHVDVKLIVATQADLRALVAENRFRVDLYHRLAVVLLNLPPLRERGEDALILARRLLEQYADAHRLAPKRLSQTAEEWLRHYPWPGNVRELNHLMERVTLLHSETVIAAETLEQLSLPRASPTETTAGADPVSTNAEAREDAADIRQSLVRTGGNVARAARLLKLSRGALRHRMGRYGISPAQFEVGRIRSSSPSRSRAPGRQRDETAGGSTVGVRSKAAVGWEQKPVVVLAVEITWPVADHEQPSYEPWTVAARQEQTIIERAEGFGGVILQRSPSLLLVAFGIPHTLDQLPQRAVQAALAVRRWAAEEVAGGRGERRVELRQGLHWGQMLVIPSVHEPPARFLPVGEALAQPVRLLGRAEPGDILLSADMGRLVETWYELEARQGPSSSDPAYAVVALRPVRTAIAMRGPLPLSRFVGREREMATLETIMTQAKVGQGQVVAILGEPGVGKSRLVWEVTHRPAADGWLILEAGGVSYGKTTSYLPVIELLKAYFQLQDRDSYQRMREKVTAKVVALDEALKPMLPPLLALLGVPVDDARWQALEPGQRRHETLEAVKRLLLRESHARPVLLVIEDLHWIDSETQALLNLLVESLPAARFLLLVVYRPEYRHDWNSKTYYAHVRLDPLSSDNADHLLEGLLGDDPGMRSLRTTLVERAEGNPLFLEESVHTLVEDQVLVGERGGYRLARSPATVAVPPTIQAALAARIDRLTPADKHLLQTAAVIGKDVPLALLLMVADLSDVDLHRGLAELQAAEFLYERRLFPDPEFTFKHVLTQEVTYRSLGNDRRRTLHGRIMKTIEALYSDRLTEHLELLAHHARSAESWEKAVAYSSEAAAKAIRRSAFREARAAFEQALAALQHLPETRETLGRAIDLLVSLRHTLVMCGELAGLEECLQQARSLADRLGDPPRSALVYLHLAAHFWLTVADQTRAIELAEAAVAIATSLGDTVLENFAAGSTGVSYWIRGDYRRARAILEKVVRFLKGRTGVWRIGVAELHYEASALLYSRFLIRSLAELGEFSEATQRADDALPVGEAADQPWVLVQACLSIGYVCLRTGDLNRAIAILERGLSVCRERGLANLVSTVTEHLGLAYALSRCTEKALPLLREAVDENARQGMAVASPRTMASLSEAYLWGGQTSEALQHAEHALQLSRQYKQHGHEAWILRLLGDVVSRLDASPSAQAHEYYSQALTLAGELGMRPLVAHCHAGLANLYRRTGKPNEAQQHFAMATTMYREMGMTYWLEKAEQEMREPA